MRQHLWNDDEAAACAEAAGPDPADRTVALRAYSARLLGSDPDLILHGGGNTSVKVTRRTLLGTEEAVLHVSGAGCDPHDVGPTELPGVWLEPLRALRRLDDLSDADLLHVQRANLLDTFAPTPCAEALVHAFLPHPVVDHTHATAFLVLANLPNAADITREIFGTCLAVVPHFGPGIVLAKAVVEAVEANPDCEGLLLLQHGHITWGETTRESYDRVIAQTNAVEEWVAQRGRSRAFDATVQRRRGPLNPAAGRQLLPVLRGAIARVRGAHTGSEARPVVADIRSGPEIAEFLERTDLDALAAKGPASPDHAILTKGPKLVLRAVDVSDPVTVAQKVEAFADRYRDTFARQTIRCGGDKTLLEPHPSLIWAEGVGLVGIGPDLTAASAIADIAEQTVEVMHAGVACGGFHPVGGDGLFDAEYGVHVLGSDTDAEAKPFAGQVVAVTGGASGIGLATAAAFAAKGAAVALIDRHAGACSEAAKEIGAHPIAVDLTAPGAARESIGHVIERFGGLDILVSNAGTAPRGDILTMPNDDIRASFEINFFAHLQVARATADVFAAQGTGGQMLFNVSKQAINPGKGFGAYGLPKATTLFLVRQLALELGDKGIRVNGLNADRIRSGIITDEMIAARAEARGVSREAYLGGNLLRREVEAQHVADAFVALARSERTTGHIMTVDGGNIEAALR